MNYSFNIMDNLIISLQKFLYQSEYELKDVLDTYLLEELQIYSGYDTLSGLIPRNILTILVEYICPSESQYVSIDKDILCFINSGKDPYLNVSEYFQDDYIIYREQSECYRVLRGIYWLFFEKHYKMNNNEIKYILRKIWWQRLYEYHTKIHVLSKYIYKFYDMILYFHKNNT